MAGPNLRVEGVPELRAKLAALGDKAERKVVRTAIRKAANIVLKEVRSRAPSKTGRLRKGLRVSVSVTAGNEVAKIGAKRRAGARHAHLLELGVRPHTIRSKYRRALRIGGRMIGGRVMHPGVRPRPFLRPGFEATKDDAIRVFKEQLQTAISEVKAMAG